MQMTGQIEGKREARWSAISQLGHRTGVVGAQIISIWLATLSVCGQVLHLV
jgi:hypothetical protein